MTKTLSTAKHTACEVGTCEDIATVTLDKAPGQAPELQVAMAGFGKLRAHAGTSHARSKNIGLKQSHSHSRTKNAVFHR